MIFNSFHYLLFLPLVTFLYYVLPPRYRWVLLLIASYYFYMVWEPWYILLIVLSTLIDYYCGLKMGDIPLKKDRRPYIALSMISNLVILGTFKYYNFFTSSVNDLFGHLGMDYMLPMANLLLPLGISFYTFQTMSYSIDVYKGKIQPEKHLGIFSLYVTFFPQLVAGPIERAKQLISQFHFNYEFKWTNIVSGSRLILLGLFKKVVIADQLSPMVSHVFNNPDEAYGLSVYIGSMLFVQQVYCDFSGYSDIARGSARFLGIELIENFKLPFHAKTLTEFWGRWHVSLMNWFRDYIMFPMVKGRWNWAVVFMIVFLISGFWHGANWTFVAWGVYNGIMVVYAKSTLDFRSKLLDRMGMKNMTGFRHFIQAVSIIHIFGLSSVFFRAQTLTDSWTLIKNLFTNFNPGWDALVSNVDFIRQDVIYMGKDSVSFMTIMFFFVALEVIQWQLRNKSLDEFFNRMPTVLRYAFYTAVILSISLMSNIGEVPFIYFQF